MTSLTPTQLSTPSLTTRLYITLYKLLAPRPDYTNPAAAITQLRATISRFNNPTLTPGVTEVTLTFPTRDAVSLRLLLFKPTSSTTLPPLLVYYHGGGCTIGSPENLAPLARTLVSKLGICVICPQYRLAPEHKFPTGALDAWDALKWIATHADEIGGDLNAGFVVGGVSAGGNFANVLSHLARDEGLTPPLTGVMLSAHQCLPPSVVLEEYKPRYLSRSDPACMDAPILDRQTKALFDAALAPDEEDPLFAVFNWPTGHAGLPATYLQVCGMEINRDEALIYEEVLKGLGVRTKMDVYAGMPHIFWSVFRGHSLTKKWWADTVEGVAWLLEKGKEAKL